MTLDLSKPLTERCYRRLSGVHPALVAVLEEAARLGPHTFIITEGLRTAARQRALFEAGATRTLNSRHLTGHAADLAVTVGGQVRWDWPLYSWLGVQVKQAAAKLGTAVVWGGDWPTFRDGPHFELDRRVFK